LKPRRRVITLFVLVFSLGAIYILYEGVTSGNYLLVALVLAAYVVVLMLEATLTVAARQVPKSGSTSARSRLIDLHPGANKMSNRYL